VTVFLFLENVPMPEDNAELTMLVDMGAQIATPGRPFDGMRAGSFVDMRGTPVTFGLAELEKYVTNTRAAIEATRGESGEVVGLPIDAKNHDKGDAAGWIIDAELSGDVIRLTPRWTNLGLELIGESRQRFFSPTVDLASMTIIGGSLTNWPATRKGGKTLLRPIELEADNPTGANPMEEMLQKIMAMIEGIAAKLNPPKEEPPTEEPGEMSSAPSAADLMQAVSTALETERATVARKQAIAEFSQRIARGTSENPRGLSVDPVELSAALESADIPALQALLEKAVLVDFSESGHGGSQPTKEQLPAPIKRYLSQWVAAGKTAEAFFSVNPELGDASNFDLSEFQEK
jgi:hypothetical protein